MSKHSETKSGAFADCDRHVELNDCVDGIGFST